LVRRAVVRFAVLLAVDLAADDFAVLFAVGRLAVLLAVVFAVDLAVERFAVEALVAGRASRGAGFVFFGSGDGSPSHGGTSPSLSGCGCCAWCG
jgi:hypothetical protein